MKYTKPHQLPDAPPPPDEPPPPEKLELLELQELPERPDDTQNPPVLVLPFLRMDFFAFLYHFVLLTKNLIIGKPTT